MEPEPSSNFPVLPEDVKHFPHMDVLESEKLQWTDVVKVLSNNGVEVVEEKQKIERTARFTLNGELMTKELEKNRDTWNKGLHHHGEEMERPGYTIEELFTLARSVFPPQRTLGLNVLSEIFLRAHNGDFDYALDTSIFQACNEIDFIHVLRVAADRQDSLSLNASINCLACLLYPEQEEICLDIAFSWPNSEPYPWFDLTDRSILIQNPSNSTSVDLSEKVTSETDLKDFQVVEDDLIKFLVNRTDLVMRFNYLLNQKMNLLKESGISGILKILIRIARHSPNRIMEHSDLLACVQQKFMVPNWSGTEKTTQTMSGIPRSIAIKLFRILATSSKENAKIIYYKFKPFNSIMSYLAYDQWHDEHLNKIMGDLILESFNLWEALMSHDIGMQEFLSFFPVMIGFFQKLYGGSKLAPFDLTHAARLHSLLAKVVNHLNKSNQDKIECAGVRECIGFASSLVVMLLSMLGRENASEFVDHDLCLLAILKGLECLNLARKYHESFPKVDAALLNFLQSPPYGKITKCLITHSLLFYESESDPEKESSKYPSNMINSGALLFGGLQTPILNKGSPFVFITSVIRYVGGMAPQKVNMPGVILDSNCRKYLETLSSKKLATRLNYFLRFELYTVWELLNCIPTEERTNSTYVHLEYKLLPHIQTGDEKLAKELLQRFITNSGATNPIAISNFYMNFLFIPTTDETPYNFKKFHKKLMSTEWITEPMSILKSMKPGDGTRQEDIYEFAKQGVETVLEFLIFCTQEWRSLVIPRISSIPNLYTRAVLPFMMGSHVFFDDKIKRQLKLMLEIFLSTQLFKKKTETNSLKPIFSIQQSKMEGYPNTFFSFYSDLMGEYCENSYGDDLFGAYLLLPLRTAERFELKAIFWQNESIQFLRTKVEESHVPLEYFTSVPETDPETIRLYKNVLLAKRVTKERNPMLYGIIDAHLKNASDLSKCSSQKSS